METYNEATIRFYDAIYSKNRTGVDAAFYLKNYLNCSGKILEVGVGTGRHFCEALHQGADIYGIDVSEGMLNKLKAKLTIEQQGRVSVQDVRSFQLDHRFDLITAPFRVFSHLHTINDQLAALNTIAAHLSDKGQFIFDLYVPNFKLLYKGMNEVLDFDGVDDEGNPLQRIVSAKNNPVSQLNDITMKYIYTEGGQSKTDEWHFQMRYYFRAELELLVAASNLEIVNMYGGFDQQELTEESKEFVIVCKRK